MLICRVTEEEAGTDQGLEAVTEEEDHSHEYQTASELFDLMAKNHNFQSNADETLTTRDLVILYKNIDLGTKLMTSANEFKRKTPNQYVETVVYNEDPESDSEISEIYSTEDLHNVVLINKERIDLLNNPSSLENTLCHKFGDLEIQTSDLTTEYDGQFLFKDPYIKEQLRSLNLISGSKEFDGTVLPASLLDYICCKRLEDNYNFYMDNIIRYVKHTIEQLKRISNGDYLTDKAKEKWREVEKDIQDDDCDDNTKILAKSTSIPLHVEQKITGHTTTWDDIVHSEVDVRYLSKILEKKIVFEVPKLLCGSYRLFSKYCEDNFIISCTREKHPTIPEEKEEDSRVDVVFKLQKSDSGHVMSNISSIIVLQKTPSVQQDDCVAKFPLPYKELEDLKEPKIMEETCPDRINDLNNDTDPDKDNEDSDTFSPVENDFDNEIKTNDQAIGTDYPNGEFALRNIINRDSDDSSNFGLKNIFHRKRNRAEASFNVIPPDELRLTMRKLNIQTSLPEESTEDTINNNRRKSPVTGRVKSPYENKSFILEERKRKKLLEIRERREKRKIAMSETCKVTKSKYGKAAIMPQSSSSVTKLSITNKSFYNSIYGQTLNMNMDHKQLKLKRRKDKKDLIGKSDFSETEEDALVATKPTAMPEIRSQKYINRSYYLDDTVTEMMYLQMKQNQKEENKDTISESTSAVSNDLSAHLKILSQLMAPSATDCSTKDSLTPREKLQRLNALEFERIGHHTKDLTSSQSSDIIVPANSPKLNEHDKKASTSNTSVEFRKSIDKIYDLMKKLGKAEGTDSKLVKSKFTATTAADRSSTVGGRGSSSIQCSDSGTSIKHHLTSSNPSYFSFEKVNLEIPKLKNVYKKPEIPTVVPKVIISAKPQIPKLEGEKNKVFRKRPINPSSKTPDNPLKAISQLLHDFDNVQKTRHKTMSECKSIKKSEPTSTDAKTLMRQTTYKRHFRLEHNFKEDPHMDRFNKIKERRPKPGHIEQLRAKRQVGDIMDEFKEARGEAVRGPSKLNARLNSLAQPKKSYVQAHIEECQSRYGRNFMSDRFQKLAANPPLVSEKNRVGSGNLKNKLRRTGGDAVPISPTKQPLPVGSPLERVGKIRQSVYNSAEDKMLPSLIVEPSYKHNNVVEKPDILKKKMVAVESYVKNHYGRVSSSTDASPLFLRGLTARVPLLPNDIELGSAPSSPPIEESTEIGRKLHNIINIMINSSPPGLTVVAEGNENSSKFSKDNIDDLSLVENLSKENLSVESDYPAYSFEECNNKGSDSKDIKYKEKNIDYIKNYDLTQIKACNSKTEMEKLETALHRRLSVGAFQKRLRIKNLTLTPKHSMQQVLVLQSGDVGSLVLKSAVSQKLNNSKSDTIADIRTVCELSNTKLNLNFTNIPMQIATVGYAFPSVKSMPNNIVDLLKTGTLKKRSLQTMNQSSCTCDNKINQCRSNDLQLERAAQVDVKEFISFSNVVQIQPVTKKEVGVVTETPQCTTENGEKTLVLQNNDQIIKTSPKSKFSKTVLNPEIPRVLKSTIVNEPKGCESIAFKEKKNETFTKDTSESVGYTSSLDILVGLLNEIQKITTCQTQITNTESQFENNKENKECVIINDASNVLNTMQNKSRDIISITSLDKLRQLESNPSIYSFYLSNDGEKICDERKVDMLSKIIDIHSEDCKTLHCEDKEIYVDIPEREFVNTFTEVPSRLFPITINNGTNVSNSLIGILSEPSTQSMFSFTETNTYRDSPFATHKKIIELPQNVLTLKETNIPIEYKYDKPRIDHNNDNFVECEKKNIIENDIKHSHSTVKDVTRVSVMKIVKKNDNFTVRSDFDPVMKMKRDVLVTVYSILVFTVFAALSFPEILYRG